MTYFGQQFGGAVHHGLEAVSHVTSTHQEAEKDDCLWLAVFSFLFSSGLHRFMVSPIFRVFSPINPVSKLPHEYAQILLS